MQSPSVLKHTLISTQNPPLHRENLPEATYVTKPYLPDKDKFLQYVAGIFDSRILTNNGPLVQELERRLKGYLGVSHVILVSNGTIALQILYKALNLSGSVITTPFSFVATSSSLKWEGLSPKYADIDPQTWNISPDQVEKLMDKDVTALVPVHVFGNPCYVDKLDALAENFKIPVIYDAAHAFSVNYKNQSLLNYGTASAVSFHSTKLFHTIEGGAIITRCDELAKKIRSMINFGYDSGKTDGLGINAKMNEFQAAMGLCLLDDIDIILHLRKSRWEFYNKHLQQDIGTQHRIAASTNNYAYFPVLFEREEDLKKALVSLRELHIFPRRYFYPSLDMIYDHGGPSCQVSRDISNRVLCLPIFPEISPKTQDIVCEVIKSKQ